MSSIKLVRRGKSLNLKHLLIYELIFSANTKGRSNNIHVCVVPPSLYWIRCPVAICE